MRTTISTSSRRDCKKPRVSNATDRDGWCVLDGRRHRAPNEICDLADRYDALVMVDDSHATGFIGAKGRGTHELRGVIDRVDILTARSAKHSAARAAVTPRDAGPSSIGCDNAHDLICFRIAFRPSSRPLAFACWIYSNQAIDCARNCARTPNTSVAAMTRSRIHARSRRTSDHSVMLGDAKARDRICSAFVEHGVYVIGFSFPVVPHGKLGSARKCPPHNNGTARSCDRCVHTGRGELGVVN